ncbi:MAG: CotH kinase family protein [Armatimonadaceae bacterium]
MMHLRRVVIPASRNFIPGGNGFVSHLDDSDTYFERGEILRIRVELPPGEVERIMQDGRPYVHGTVVENDRTVYRDVAIKLKGAAGSTRSWDDRPALTINVDKFKKGQSFHGMDKFHLNNSVQDGTLLSEFTSSLLFRSAGYPATRVSHARVSLNGRDVGMYVLKEGFDKTFLKRWFKDPDGNLYDGGFVQDIDAPLERDAGKGEDTRADLTALLNACRISNPFERWKAVEKVLDIPSFLTFMAGERILCHWDGYCNNVNNYRVYFDTKRVAHFMPHGMDQMLGDSGFSMFDQPRGMVAGVVLQNPAWRQQYRKRIAEMLPLMAPNGTVVQGIEQVTGRLLYAQQQVSDDAAKAQRAAADDWKRRVPERAANVAGQLRVAEPPLPAPLVFDETNTGYPAEWKKTFQVADTKFESGVSNNGLWTYSIKVGRSGVCIAAWRASVVLAAGEYTFRAKCRTKDLQAMEDGNASAAGIRLGDMSRSERVEGTTEKELLFPFTVTDDRREVILTCEVRARRGQVWFDGPVLIRTKGAEPAKPSQSLKPQPAAKPAAKPKPPVKKPPVPVKKKR